MSLFPNQYDMFSNSNFITQSILGIENKYDSTFVGLSNSNIKMLVLESQVD